MTLAYLAALVMLAALAVLAYLYDSIEGILV